MATRRNPDRKIDVWVVGLHKAADAPRKRAEQFAGQEFRPRAQNVHDGRPLQHKGLGK